jgi:hypothetical protein
MQPQTTSCAPRASTRLRWASVFVWTIIGVHRPQKRPSCIRPTEQTFQTTVASSES